MSVKMSINVVAFAIVSAFGLTSAPIVAQAVCIDEPCPPPAPTHHSTYRGAFSLENSTGVAINYQVKWGSNEQWTSEKLNSGIIRTHWYPLDSAGKAPAPYVRFDRIGGDSAYQEQEYHMEFYKVGSDGSGDPKRYIFRYASDGRHLDIKAK
jgi:hypothetical protein